LIYHEFLLILFRRCGIRYIGLVLTYRPDYRFIQGTSADAKKPQESGPKTSGFTNHESGYGTTGYIRFYL
jgi:hypothetical protein